MIFGPFWGRANYHGQLAFRQIASVLNSRPFFSRDCGDCVNSQACGMAQSRDDPGWQLARARPFGLCSGKSRVVATTLVREEAADAFGGADAIAAEVAAGGDEDVLFDVIGEGTEHLVRFTGTVR